jgi:hypothetical protein
MEQEVQKVHEYNMVGMYTTHNTNLRAIRDEIHKGFIVMATVVITCTALLFIPAIMWVVSR